MAQGYLFETMTGRIVDRFPTQGSWDVKPNEPETMKCGISMRTAREKRRGWGAIAEPWAMSIALEQDGRYYGGPIQPKTYKDATIELDITTRGIGRLLDQNLVLPPEAETAPLVLPNGQPNTALDTVLEGLDYASIAKRLVQQYCAWDGGNLPIVFPPDVAGTRRRVYEALDLKELGDAVWDLTEVLNGPDIRIALERKNETHFQWVWQAGTELQPRLQSDTVHSWNTAAAKPSAGKLEFTTDPSEMADVVFSLGERTDERTVAARAVSRRLRDAGKPLMMRADTGHTDVKELATSQSYADEILRRSWAEAQFWQFEASRDRGPKLKDVREGDLLTIKVANHGLIPAGEYTRRIAALSGDTTSKTFKVVCAGALDG